MRKHPDPTLALSIGDCRALEEKRIQLQLELTRVSASHTLADVLSLFDDTFAFASTFFRDAASQAATVAHSTVSRRRLGQSRALDDAAREIKRMAQVLGAVDPRVRTTYLLVTITGMLGFTASDEVAGIIKEAQRGRPPPPNPARHPPLPSPQALFYSPQAPPAAQFYQPQAPPAPQPQAPLFQPQALPAPPAPAPLPPPPLPAPNPAGRGNEPGRNRGIGKVIPGCTETIGANVPNAVDASTKSCYLCSRTGHLAYSCYLSAPVRLHEPFPGWTANGTKVQELWSSPTNITPACAKLWIDYLRRHQIVGNPDSLGRYPLPDFAAVAAQ